MTEDIDRLVKESLQHATNPKRSEESESPGLIFAEGDSWFDYLAYDILDKLDWRGFDVEHVANRGDTLLEMARCRAQHYRLAKLLLKIARDKRRPSVILVSGGGNDLAKKGTLRKLLNRNNTDKPILNREAVGEFVDVTLRQAYIDLLHYLTFLSRKIFPNGKSIPIVVHGYAYPVPDGTQFSYFIFWRRGPWLKHEFKKRGYRDREQNTEAMKMLLDRFNDMVQGLSSEPGLKHVKYVDLRGCLSNKLRDKDYKRHWDNEMHPTPEGFEIITNKIEELLVEMGVSKGQAGPNVSFDDGGP